MAGQMDKDSRLANLLRPIRDLAENWNINVAKDLEDYLEELEHVQVSFDGGKTNLNFAEAALLIQGSACIYSRKVEYLYNLIYQALDMVHAQSKTKRKGGPAPSQEDADAAALEAEANEEFLLLDDVLVEGRAIDLPERMEDVESALHMSFYYNGVSGSTPAQRKTAASLLARTPLSVMAASQFERRDGNTFRVSAYTVAPTGALMVESTNAAAVSTDLFNLSIAPIEPTAGSPHSAVASFLSPQLLTGGARQNATNVSVLAPSMALHPPPHPGGDVSVSLVGLTAPPALGSHAHFDEHNHSYGDMGDDYEGGYDDDAYAPSFAKAADGNEMSSAAPMPSHEQSVAHQRPTRRVAATAAMVAAADTQSSSMQEEQVEEEALAGEVDMWAQLDANAPGGGPGATVKPYRRGRTFIVLKNAKLVSHQGARVAAATARAAAGSSGVVKSPVRDAALTGGAILPTRLQSWSMSAFSSHNPLWSELLPLQRRHAANAARERLAALRGPAAGGGTTSSTLMHDPGAVASTLDGMGGDDYEGGYDDAAFEAGGMHSPAGNDDMLRWLDDAPAAAVMEERARTAQAHALTLDEAFDNTVEDGTADYATLVERHMRHIEAYVREAGMAAHESAMSRRVSDWQCKLAPVLEQEDTRREFDIVEYSTEIIDAMASLSLTQGDSHVAPPEEEDAARIVQVTDVQDPSGDGAGFLDFAEVVQGQARFDVCRAFLATLQLANNGNVEIAPPSPGCSVNASRSRVSDQHARRRAAGDHDDGVWEFSQQAVYADGPASAECHRQAAAVAAGMTVQQQLRKELLYRGFEDEAAFSACSGSFNVKLLHTSSRADMQMDALAATAASTAAVRSSTRSAPTAATFADPELTSTAGTAGQGRRSSTKRTPVLSALVANTATVSVDGVRSLKRVASHRTAAGARRDGGREEGDRAARMDVSDDERAEKENTAFAVVHHVKSVGERGGGGGGGGGGSRAARQRGTSTGRVGLVKTADSVPDSSDDEGAPSPTKVNAGPGAHAKRARLARSSVTLTSEDSDSLAARHHLVLTA